MNASWSMVFGALLAGTVAGFMIPVRPEIRDVPALTASKATEPVTKSASGKTDTSAAAKTADAAEVRQIPLTEPATAQNAKSDQTGDQIDANSCAKETWPYRTPGCLDRTAAVAPAATVVPAKPVEPTAGPIAATSPPAAKPAAAPKPAEAPAARSEPAKPEQKTAAAPSAREEPAANPTPPAEQASARSGDEPRAHAVNERQNARQEEAAPAKPRRAARRVNRNTVDLDDGIPTRIYLRGPDGRLHLAPEYRPSGRTIYFVR